MSAPLVVMRIAAESGPLLSWAWSHMRSNLGDATTFVKSAVENPGSIIRRIGNSIVYNQSEGETKTIAFIEQTAPKIEHIDQILTDVQSAQNSMITTLDSMQVGQQALSSSLASLQSVSMISLGFSAVVPIILQVQFTALNKRLNALFKIIQGLDKKFDAQKSADLKTGLDMLDLGVQSQKRNNDEARQRFNVALDYCMNSSNYFSKLLENELNEKKPNRQEVRILSRQLSVTLLGMASCHIGLEDDAQAIAHLDARMPLLGRSATWVFRETVGKDPTRFLPLTVGSRQVSLGFMSELYQQAKDAGLVDTTRNYSPEEWFEEYRAEILAGRRQLPFRKSRREQSLLNELAEALSTVEEINRIIGIENLIKDVRNTGLTNREVQAKLQEQIKAEVHDSPFVAWSPHKVGT